MKNEYIIFNLISILKMNASILINSFKYLVVYDLTCSLSIWTYQELSRTKYTDDILNYFFNNNELSIAESIICCNQDKLILNNLYVTSFNYDLVKNEDNIYKRIKILLKYGVDVDYNDSYILKQAVYNDFIPLIKLLLKFNTNISVALILYLCRDLRIDIIRLILESGPYGAARCRFDININNGIILKEICLTQNIELAKLFLDFGANVHIDNNEILRIVNKKGCYDMIKLITEHMKNSRINVSMLVTSFKYLRDYKLICSTSTWIYQELSMIKYSDSKLIKSFKTEDIEVTESITHLNKDKILLDKLLSKAFYCNQMFEDMIYRLVKILLQNGANIHIRNDKILRTAARYNYLKILKLALQYGADIHAKNEQALITTASKGYIESFLLLFEQGADIHINNEEPFREACENDHIEIVLLLLQNDVDVHANDNQALKSACSYNNKHIAKLLIENGATIRNMMLANACEMGYSKIVKLLLRANSIEHIDYHKLLCHAIYNDHVKVIKQILRYDIDIKIIDIELKEACRRDNVEIIKLLLEYGAVVTDKHIRIARFYNHTEILELLNNALTSKEF